MNMSNYFQDTSFSSIPHILWQYYIDYLWNYEDASWVAKIANTSRVLAIAVILPVVVLAMLVRTL